jgi:hypothetical protein
MDNDYRDNGRNGRARPIRHIRILAAVFVTERSLMFAYVRLKSLMFAFFEKKYFFPALYTPWAGTQRVGPSGAWNQDGEMERRSFGVLGERSGKRRFGSADFRGKSADCYALLRESSRKFAQIRAVNPQCYALLRVGPFFDKEAKK